MRAVLRARTTYGLVAVRSTRNAHPAGYPQNFLSVDRSRSRLDARTRSSERTSQSPAIREEYPWPPALLLPSNPQPAKTLIAKDHLKAFVERIERLEEEKKAIADDIRDVYAEAKGNGFDIKALRTIVRLRKQDKDERVEQETILQTYMVALGMI